MVEPLIVESIQNVEKMLKPFSLLCDVILTVAFGFALWCLSMVYAQAMDPKYWFFPPVYVQLSQAMLSPCVHAVESHLISGTSQFGQNQFQLAYGALACIGLAVGTLFLWISSVATSLNNRVVKLATALKEKAYLQRFNREKQVTTRGQSKVGPALQAQAAEEFCALLGIHFENLEHYPQLQRALAAKLDRFSPDTLLYEGDTRILLKLRSTMMAIEGVHEFRDYFQQASRGLRLLVGNMPSMRFVVHSVGQSVHIMDEDGLVQSLLNCAGANQLILSPSARDQYVLQNKRRTTPFPYQVRLLGTFSVQNHPLERVDVYKLTTQSP